MEDTLVNVHGHDKELPETLNTECEDQSAALLLQQDSLFTKQDRLLQALRDVKENGLAQNVAAKKWGVSKSTLGYWIRGKLPVVARLALQSLEKDHQSVSQKRKGAFEDLLLSQNGKRKLCPKEVTPVSEAFSLCRMERLTRALFDVQNNGLLQQAAANKWLVSRSTLNARIHQRSGSSRRASIVEDSLSCDSQGDQFKAFKNRAQTSHNLEDCCISNDAIATPKLSVSTPKDESGNGKSIISVKKEETSDVKDNVSSLSFSKQSAKTPGKNWKHTCETQSQSWQLWPQIIESDPQSLGLSRKERLMYALEDVNKEGMSQKLAAAKWMVPESTLCTWKKNMYTTGRNLGNPTVLDDVGTRLQHQELDECEQVGESECEQVGESVAASEQSSKDTSEATAVQQAMQDVIFTGLPLQAAVLRENVPLNNLSSFIPQSHTDFTKICKSNDELQNKSLEVKKDKNVQTFIKEEFPLRHRGENQEDLCNRDKVLTEQDNIDEESQLQSLSQLKQIRSAQALNNVKEQLMNFHDQLYDASTAAETTESAAGVLKEVEQPVKNVCSGPDEIIINTMGDTQKLHKKVCLYKAVQDVLENNMTQKDAAAKWRVPKSTLFDWLHTGKGQGEKSKQFLESFFEENQSSDEFSSRFETLENSKCVKNNQNKCKLQFSLGINKSFNCVTSLGRRKRLSAAIYDVQNNNMTQAAAVRKWQVPKSTLCHWLNGRYQNSFKESLLPFSKCLKKKKRNFIGCSSQFSSLPTRQDYFQEACIHQETAVGSHNNNSLKIEPVWSDSTNSDDTCLTDTDFSSFGGSQDDNRTTDVTDKVSSNEMQCRKLDSATNYGSAWTSCGQYCMDDKNRPETDSYSQQERFSSHGDISGTHLENSVYKKHAETRPNLQSTCTQCSLRASRVQVDGNDNVQKLNMKLQCTECGALCQQKYSTASNKILKHESNEKESAEKVPFFADEDFYGIADISNWSMNFKTFLSKHNLSEKPGSIYACEKMNFLFENCATNSQSFNVTVLTCISATGHALPPYLIFPQKPNSWDPHNCTVSGTQWTVTDSSTEVSMIYFQWLNTHVLPNIPSSRPIVLLFNDYADKGLNCECMMLLQESQIFLYKLHSFGTGIEKLINSHWTALLKKEETKIGRKLTMKLFIKLLSEAWLHVVTPLNILRTFHESAIFPFYLDTLNSDCESE